MKLTKEIIRLFKYHGFMTVTAPDEDILKRYQTVEDLTNAGFVNDPEALRMAKMVFVEDGTPAVGPTKDEDVAEAPVENENQPAEEPATDPEPEKVEEKVETETTTIEEPIADPEPEKEVESVENENQPAEEPAAEPELEKVEEKVETETTTTEEPEKESEPTPESEPEAPAPKPKKTTTKKSTKKES